MDYWLNILTLIGIYAMLAMSLNVMTGLTGMLSLGHVGFFAAGAYAAGLTAIYATVPALGAGNLVLSVAAAMLVAAILAAAIGLPCLRLRGDYLAIATLGFAEILRLTLNNVEFPGCPLTDGETFGGATGIGLPYAMGEPGVPSADYVTWWMIWAAVLGVYGLMRNLKRSALGRAMMCIRGDEVAARAMGIHVPRYKMLAFLLSAAVAGLAGALYVHNGAFGVRVKPNDFDLLKMLELLLMVVLGGLGSLSGSVLAATALVLLPELLRFVPAIPIPANPVVAMAELRLSEHRQILYAILLIVLIRLAPNGLLGASELPDWLRFGRRRGRRGRPAEATRRRPGPASGDEEERHGA